jgi:hypothetical protein
LNIGPETNHFSELSISVSAVLDIKITIVFGASVSGALLQEASTDTNSLIIGYLQAGTLWLI